MIWNRLKKYKCPKCLDDLEKQDQVHACVNCDFVISHQRFDEIVNDMYKPTSQRTLGYNDEDENLSKLNNL